MCSSSALVCSCVLVGGAFLVASVSGIGFSLFLLFGDPFYGATDGTYDPSFEDIGPAFVVSVMTLVMSILLIGGAKQGSKDMIFAWVVWMVIAAVIFWLWYGYSELKHYNYIDWTHAGMKSCYYCGHEAEQYVGIAGAVFSLLIIIGIIPVEMLRSKLKKRHRELTELTDLDNIRGDGGDNASSSMMRYLQDNQRYSQQDLSSLTSVPYNQSNGYNQVVQPQQPNTQQYTQQNLNQYYGNQPSQQNISQTQYQQMSHASQQNYLMQQHILQQQQQQQQQQQHLLQQQRQQQQQQQQQNFNYQPTHPAYYQ